METFIQQIINGLVLGSVYALIALGYTMVYGIINLINFAHGEVLMVGALTSWTVVTALQDTMPGCENSHRSVSDTLLLAHETGSYLESLDELQMREARVPAAAKGAPPRAADHGDGCEPAAADARDDHLEAELQVLPDPVAQ